MADLLIPIKNHFFTAAQLQAAVTAAETDHPGKANVLSATVDADGIKTVLVLGSQDGRWKVHTAFGHDSASGSTFAAGGSIAW